ncbi:MULTISPECIES: DUF3990 domain-containing protein [Clostridia]|uniref:DUF3990 domain-containing protein n=1 Tax=Clostridia TaxID=186801 RepID=UPI0015FDBE68|nr:MULTISPECIES: DUF3990 domain-containing protein [Clostridia]
MKIVNVFHGSDHIIRGPEYLGGKEDNDYGNGFYTTEYEERAKSWAALNGNANKAIVNSYELDLEGLCILDLNEYGVLAWIAEVVSNRGMNQEAAAIVGRKLVEMYKVNTEEFDIIKGYRADDSYTQVVEAFLTNQINIMEVERMFYKGSLGNQIFLKSEKAFTQIRWTGYYEVTPENSHKQEDIKARREVNKFMQGRMKAILLDGFAVPGITAQYAANKLLTYHKEGDYYE